MEPNKELELYKLVNGHFECGWINDDDFLIWVEHYNLSDFCKSLSEIFGDYIFEEGGIEASLLKDDVCFHLTSLEGDDIDFKRVFPKDEFKH